MRTVNELIAQLQAAVAADPSVGEYGIGFETDVEWLWQGTYCQDSVGGNLLLDVETA